MLASSNGHLKILKLLSENNADLNIQNDVFIICFLYYFLLFACRFFKFFYEVLFFVAYQNLFRFYNGIIFIFIFDKFFIINIFI
jgi:hypothetical protein